MAPKEVRRLDFVPYKVADKERDRRRVQVHYTKVLQLLPYERGLTGGFLPRR